MIGLPSAYPKSIRLLGGRTIIRLTRRSLGRASPLAMLALSRRAGAAAKRRLAEEYDAKRSDGCRLVGCATSRLDRGACDEVAGARAQGCAHGARSDKPAADLPVPQPARNDPHVLALAIHGQRNQTRNLGHRPQYGDPRGAIGRDHRSCIYGPVGRAGIFSGARLCVTSQIQPAIPRNHKARSRRKPCPCMRRS